MDRSENGYIGVHNETHFEFTSEFKVKITNFGFFFFSESYCRNFDTLGHIYPTSKNLKKIKAVSTYCQFKITR